MELDVWVFALLIMIIEKKLKYFQIIDNYSLNFILNVVYEMISMGLKKYLINNFYIF